MKKWIKKLSGLDEIEQAALGAVELRKQEELKIQELKKQKQTLSQDIELARMSPKEQADSKKEPWISVVDVKVNKDNLRNGFFELDWNSYFIQELIENGYGTEADPEEEIVDRWFRTIVYQMLNEQGLDSELGAGYINVTAISDSKSEVS